MFTTFDELEHFCLKSWGGIKRQTSPDKDSHALIHFVIDDIHRFAELSFE